MKKTSSKVTKGYQPRHCPLCPAQYMKLEKLFDHMKEVHQGRMFGKPDVPSS